MFYDFTKRLIDFTLSFFGLIVALPIMAAVAIAIMIDSPGPAIFRQERVTRNGKNFRMYKFRSMVVGAEQILYNDPELLKEYESGNYKLADDPRITRMGRFIRKTSIDELPQLLNVLTGEMSLVGPRAYRPIELKKEQMANPGAHEEISAILTVKPGITGPWQVSGRSKISFTDRVRMDAQYARRRSIIYDLWIIIKTPLAVIHQEGAA